MFHLSFLLLLAFTPPVRHLFVQQFPLGRVDVDEPECPALGGDALDVGEAVVRIGDDADVAAVGVFEVSVDFHPAGFAGVQGVVATGVDVMSGMKAISELSHENDTFVDILARPLLRTTVLSFRTLPILSETRSFLCGPTCLGERVERSKGRWSERRGQAQEGGGDGDGGRCGGVSKVRCPW